MSADASMLDGPPPAGDKQRALASTSADRPARRPLRSLSDLGLFSQHVEKLTSSAVAVNVAQSRRYQSVDTKKRLADLGFAASQQSVPGLLIPLWDQTGQQAGYQYRPDFPRIGEHDRVVKYESIPKSQPVLDVSPVATQWVYQASAPLWITEGALKGDALASAGLAAIALSGVSSWTSGGTALGGWRDIPLRGREVVIAFDSDVMTKESVQAALRSLAFYLRSRGAAVRQCLLPASGDEKVGVDDYLYGGHSAAELINLVVELPEDTPQPLPTAREVPAFPVGMLPPVMAALVSETAEFTQVDPGMVATSALTAVSAALLGRLHVIGRPGWVEPGNIFTCTVAAPAERKSAVQTMVFAPLRELERQLQEEEGPEIRERRMKWEIKHKRFEKAKDAASKAPRGGERAAEADAVTAMEDLERAQKELREPVRLLAGDVTPEKLVALIAEQGGRMAVASTEGGLFGTFNGRYARGMPNFDTLLQAHSGDAIRVDRKNGPTQVVNHPSLTVGLMIQPQVLEGLMGDREMSGRGLLARFLWAVPPSRVGFRKIIAEPISETTTAAWTELLSSVGRQSYRAEEPVALSLSPRAAAIQVQHQQDIEIRLRPDGDLHSIAFWAGKMAGATLRLAGLLHVTYQGWCQQEALIDEGDYRSAMAVTHYYAEHAKAAYDLAMLETGIGGAVELLNYLGRQQLAGFTERELFSKLSRNRWATVAGDLRPALDVLLDYGWISRIPYGASNGAGRNKSPHYLVHPDTLRAGDRDTVTSSADSAEGRVRGSLEGTAARPASVDSAESPGAVVLNQGGGTERSVGEDCMEVDGLMTNFFPQDLLDDSLWALRLMDHADEQEFWGETQSVV